MAYLFQMLLIGKAVIESDSEVVGVGSWAITLPQQFTLSIFLASELLRWKADTSLDGLGLICQYRM